MERQPQPVRVVCPFPFVGVRKLGQIKVLLRRLMEDVEYELGAIRFVQVAQNAEVETIEQGVIALLGDVTQEETDKYKESTNKETSPSKNADKRAKTFSCPKRIKSSTPSIPTGTINLSYEAGSQSKFEMGCPHCGEYIELIFPQIKWDPDAKNDGDWYMDAVEKSSRYECQLCGGVIHDAHKSIMYRKYRWVHTNPNAPRSHISCNVPSWYASWPDCTFGKTAVKYLTALADFSMQDFDTNEKGMPYEIESRKLEWEKLYDRREEYDQPIPDRVAMLVGFCDVQDDWIEFGIIGYGEKTENWLVEHRIIEGDPAQKVVWDELAYHVTRPRRLPLDWFGVDHGGHFAQEVQEFVVKMNRAGYRFVRAMKGDSKPWSQITGRITWSQKHHPRCKIYFTGTDNAKRVLVTMMQVEPPAEIGKPTRGLCHFPEWFTDEMAQQICAEKMQPKKVRGKEEWEWVPTRKRNELLDIYVGCYTGFKRVGEQRFKKRIVDMRRRLENPPDPVEELKAIAEEKPKPKPQRARRSRQTSGWINQ